MKSIFVHLCALFIASCLSAISQPRKPAPTPQLPPEIQQQKRVASPEKGLQSQRAIEGDSQPDLPPKAPRGIGIVNARAKKVMPKAPYDSREGRMHGRRMLRQIDQFTAYLTQAKLKLNQMKTEEEATEKLFNAWVKKICAENGWNPKEYQYDIASDTWFHLVPTASPGD